MFNSKTYNYIDSYNIQSICEKYNIKKIDILKLDVEGVAFEVLEDCILNNILPDQICLEKERPLLKNQIKYFYNLIKFKNYLKKIMKYIIIQVQSSAKELSFCYKNKCY